jgi:hypothetical protein
LRIADKTTKDIYSSFILDYCIKTNIKISYKNYKRLQGKLAEMFQKEVIALSLATGKLLPSPASNFYS